MTRTRDLLQCLGLHRLWQIAEDEVDYFWVCVFVLTVVVETGLSSNQVLTCEICLLQSSGLVTIHLVSLHFGLGGSLGLRSILLLVVTLKDLVTSFSQVVSVIVRLLDSLPSLEHFVNLSWLCLGRISHIVGDIFLGLGQGHLNRLFEGYILRHQLSLARAVGVLVRSIIRL